MKELNGLKYSHKSFDTYKNRAIAIFKKDGEEHILDIYTTDTNKESFIEVLKSLTKKGVEFVGLDHWCTREQDDRDAELIDEW